MKQIPRDSYQRLDLACSILKRRKHLMVIFEHFRKFHKKFVSRKGLLTRVFAQSRSPLLAGNIVPFSVVSVNFDAIFMAFAVGFTSVPVAGGKKLRVF